ncbi:MAG TPA: tetratricopeptide repeat protein [Longimicrobiaceae bacterium]|jgi:serine/threonine-protein kinase
MLALQLLGGAFLTDGGAPVSGPAAQRHRLALLALLAASPGGRASRDRLVALLWPESGGAAARRLLNVALHALRGRLGDDALLSLADDVVLRPEAVPSDVGRFRAALDAGDRRAAAGVYAGPFLHGFHLGGAGEFDRWAEGVRGGLARAHQEALEALAEEAAAAGDARGAAGWWRRLAAEDPACARVALRLMEALERAGDRAGALRHAAVHAALLREELDAEPDPEVLALAERLRRAPAVSPPAPAERAPEPAAAEPPARPAPRAGIAVLPFEDDTRGRRGEYFSDGLTEEITDALSRVRGLRVIARTSAFAFRGTPLPAPEIGRRLGVDHLLEGSVRRSGRSLRVGVRLVEAATGSLLWSGRYEGEVGDVFAVQDEIARAVVGALRVELAGEGGGPLVLGSTGDPEAHALYLRGRAAWYARTPRGLEEAVAYFGRALERDPDYALAHIGVADACNMLGAFDYGVRPPGEVYPRAREAAARALALRPDLAEAHTALASVLLNHEWDWEGAARAFRHALRLNPGYAMAYQWYSLYLGATGRHAEALEAVRRARELDPVSPVMGTALARQLYFARDFAAAAREYRGVLAQDPGFLPARLGLGLVLAQAGAVEDALAELERARDAAGDAPALLALLGHAQARAGRRAEARGTLARLRALAAERWVPPEYFAAVHLGLGDADAALDQLERACDARSGSVVYLGVDPLLDPVRADPRFRRLCARVGLPASA